MKIEPCAFCGESPRRYSRHPTLEPDRAMCETSDCPIGLTTIRIKPWNRVMARAWLKAFEEVE